MTRESGYMLQLDGLRCLAVLGVVMTHTWTSTVIEVGALGVYLFFVLSGFLITGILLDARDDVDRAGGAGRLHAMRQFYVRRFLRIFPLYYIVLALLVVAGIMGSRADAPWLFTYTTNFYIWSRGQWLELAHFWSLAVEEQFYLVWPWLLLALPRRAIAPVLVCLILLAPLYRLFASFAYYSDLTTKTYTTGVFPLASLDSLGMGALLAIAIRSRGSDYVISLLCRVALPIGLFTFVAGLGLYSLGDIRTIFVLGETACAMMFCWLVAQASAGFNGWFGRVLAWPPVVYLGKISYGVYVLHLVVAFAVKTAAAHLGVRHPSGFANFAINLTVTACIASLSWYAIEAPINRLKRFFPYRRAVPLQERPDLVAAQ